jgi:hypothetical protein
MTPEMARATLRLTLAERELARFDSWRDPDDPRHERTLRKLRQHVERAEADLAWIERQLDRESSRWD